MKLYIPEGVTVREVKKKKNGYMHYAKLRVAVNPTWYFDSDTDTIDMKFLNLEDMAVSPQLASTLAENHWFVHVYVQEIPDLVGFLVRKAECIVENDNPVNSF